MALAKKLQSEGSCGEGALGKECENDNQGEQDSKTEACSFERSYSIDSSEFIRLQSPTSSENSVSIRSLRSLGSGRSGRSFNSSASLGGGGIAAVTLGEADTVDDTLVVIKEDKSMGDTSLDTNEDDLLASRTMRGNDTVQGAAAEKRKKRKERIADIDQNEQLRLNSIAKRKERKNDIFDGLSTETKLKEGTNEKVGFVFPTSKLDEICESANSHYGHDSTALMEQSLATIFSDHSNDHANDVSATFSASATFSTESNIKKSKKKKSKKGSVRSPKRKPRKAKIPADSTAASWWNLSNGINSPINSPVNSPASPKKRKVRKAASAVEEFGPLSPHGDKSVYSIDSAKEKGTAAIQQNDCKATFNVEASDSLHAIDVEDCEDIKDSSHIATSSAMNEPVTSAVTSSDSITPSNVCNETNEPSKNSGYNGAMGLNDMIAAAAKKREERIAANGPPKLPFQSPFARKESLSSRLQKKQHFPAPLSPQPAECDDTLDVAAPDVATSTTEKDKNDEDNKPSGHGAALGLNDMIAAAAAERQNRLAASNKSPKLPFQSPFARKESLSSRVQTMGFPTPLSPQTTENESISAFAKDEESLSSINFYGNETEDRKHEMTIAEMAADVASKRNERVKTFKYFEPVALSDEQKKKDKENHRKKYVPVAGEAATYGRLVRLEEKVVEAQGGVNHQPVDRYSTWTGPKMRTDDRRSSALRAIQEAAAMGRMKGLKPEIVTNYDEDDSFYPRLSMSDSYFDVDNQFDEHGEKQCRTNFLLDRHVKEILRGKKERMFACSDAVGDRDEKIATYKDFDDVVLPTETLPTFDRIVGKRLNSKSFSSGADLAMIAMQMSEGNIKPSLDEEEEDSPKMTMKRLRVLESISNAVASSAWKRDARLKQPRATLKVTRKCMCPYCKDPTPYQTHKYKRLMYPERFNENNDNPDQSNYCQEVGETIGTIAEAAKASHNSYAISPGGRKKKVIRIVRRKKRRPKGLAPATNDISPSDKERVIEATSLTPGELESLTEQLQRQGAKGMTTDELVLIANALRDKTSTTVDATSMKKEAEPHSLSNQLSPSPEVQQETERATDLKNSIMTSEQMLQLESKLVFSPLHDEQQEGTDITTDQSPQVANDLKAENQDDRQSRLEMPACLPFLDTEDDISSTPPISTKRVEMDTITERQPAETPSRKTGKSGPANRGSSKARIEGKLKSPKSRKPKKSLSEKDPKVAGSKGKTKSTKTRKPKKSVSAPSPMAIAEKVPKRPDVISPKNQQKKKSVRRRAKETMQSPTQNTMQNLPAPPSGAGDAPPKKTLRSRLRSLTRSTSPRRRNEISSISEQEPQDENDRTSKSATTAKSKSSRRRAKRSHSLRPHLESTDPPPSRIKESFESLLPRARKRSASNPHSVKTQEQKKNWAPERRAPSRTHSLNESKKDGIRKPPSRTSSLQDHLLRPNNNADAPGQIEVPSNTDKGSASPKRSPKQSPNTKLRRKLKKKNLPAPPSPQIDINPSKSDDPSSKPIPPPIPSVITVDFSATLEEFEEFNSNNPNIAGTGDRSESSVLRNRPKSHRRSLSLDPAAIQSRTKAIKKGKKPSVDGPEQFHRDGEGKESQVDPSNISPKSPLRVPKRGRSLDRYAILKLGGRAKENGKEKTLDKKKKKNWLRKGS